MKDEDKFAQWVRDAIQGDDEACHSIMAEYLDNGELERFVKGQSPHPKSDVEALVNDTLMEMVRDIPDFKPPTDPDKLVSAFSGWVREIARRNVLDDARFHEAKKRGGDVDIIESEEDLFAFVTSESATASQVRASEKMRRKAQLASDFLKDTVAGKDDGFFDPFTLYLNGATINEIAETLGIQTGVVGHRIRSAKELLREQWSELSVYVSTREPNRDSD